eukprot:CAMPEP_0183716826 /NCGR_PEP_ID=MMETSP0737-20130205/10598_1 /TAXON_ID=385413 /ORGANISM="Thalassiosira miniscula, Strain CCMP1093" /LENGTH=803 /DNA_ID=CAMNT_0025946149 /DNA_START=31 /DNA_END=2442 /DNA_ORIENTATION=+
MKVSSTALAFTLFASTSRVRAFSNAASTFALSRSTNYHAPARTNIDASCPTNIARTMSTVAEDTTATSNPLLDTSDLPKFTKIEPSQLTPAMTSILEKLEADFASMESTMGEAESVDFDDVLPVLEKMQHPLGYAWGIASHLNGVKNGDELRAAYEENQPKIVQATMKFSQSKPLYDALVKVQQSWEAEESKEDDFVALQKKRAVENSLRGMKLGGVGLEEGSPEQIRFKEIKMRFAELSTAFSNNVLDATKAFGLEVTDAADVEGVPESAKAMWAQAHQQHLIAECKDDEEKKKELQEMKVDPNAGPWRITLDGPSYIAAMQHMPNREIRKEVYLGYLTRASEFTAEKLEKKDGEEKKEGPGKNNVPIIQEILKLRKEMSGILGFSNYAEMSLASKMAPDVASVTDLSNLIRDKALPAAEKELAAATAVAREVGGDQYSEANLEKLMPWDAAFWTERLKEKTFDLKEEELRPYFALDAVLKGMFELIERIFDIEVREANGKVEVWHPDVQFFELYDKESGTHVASFYLDPYSRPADKRGGAWMADCQGKSDALGIDVPVAYLTCNGSPPVGDKPSLMTFREVETLFHETGHGLQHMLTKAIVGDVAGINGVEWDAVELPSQFMENWCYDKPTVYGFAKHYETGEALPEEMFEKLKQQKTFGAGMMSCRQLLFGMMDMELHSNYDPDGDETIFDVQRRMADIYTPYAKPVDEDRFLCGFGHIFAGGYSAGYYSYKWAEVMSADAFGAFEEVGLDNEEGVREVGRKFRDTVLSLGGGVAPMDVFTQFRGREPSPEALLRHNGLA